MGILTPDRHLRIAEIAGDAGANGKRLARLHELWRLLNVQLDPSLDAFGVEAGLAPTHLLNSCTTIAHVLGKGAARVDAPGLKRPRWEHAKGRSAADIRTPGTKRFPRRESLLS